MQRNEEELELLREAAEVLDVRGFNLDADARVEVTNFFMRSALLTAKIRAYLARVDGEEQHP